jgi:hypothetical protein
MLEFKGRTNTPLSLSATSLLQKPFQSNTYTH